MIICPYCDAENIEGADACEECNTSLSDLHLPTPATSIERNLLRDRISTLYPNAPIVVTADTPVRAAMQMLVDKRIGCVLVVDGDSKLLGIFSERDALVKLSVDITEKGDEPVSNYMTSSPETLDTQAKIAFAVHQMDVGGYRHLPIVQDDGKACGVISVRDILNYLTTVAAG